MPFLIYGFITYVYYRPTGDKYVWIWTYSLSGFRTVIVTTVIWDNPVTLRDTLLRAFPGTYGL